MGQGRRPPLGWGRCRSLASVHHSQSRAAGETARHGQQGEEQAKQGDSFHVVLWGLDNHFDNLHDDHDFAVSLSRFAGRLIVQRSFWCVVS